jgi:hypothetical protein
MMKFFLEDENRKWWLEQCDHVEKIIERQDAALEAKRRELEKERAELEQLRSDLEVRWKAVTEFMARVGMPKKQTT